MRAITRRILYAIWFLGVSVSSAMFTVRFLVRTGENIEVPKLVGKSTPEAEAELSSKKLKLDIQGSQFSEDYPEQIILHQTVPPGESVREGRSIGVILSKGGRTRETPQLVGLDLDAAKLILASSDLELEKSADACSEEIAQGKIIAQDPPATLLMDVRKIHVLVSTGSCANRFVIPETDPRPLKEWLSDLDRKGFVVRFVRYEERGDVPPLTVLAIRPEPGSVVRNIDSISFIASRAVKGTESLTGSKWVYMPIHGPIGLFGRAARLTFVRGLSEGEDVIDFFLPPGENAEFVVWMPAKGEATLSLDETQVWHKEFPG